MGFKVIKTAYVNGLNLESALYVDGFNLNELILMGSTKNQLIFWVQPKNSHIDAFGRESGHIAKSSSAHIVGFKLNQLTWIGSIQNQLIL